MALDGEKYEISSSKFEGEKIRGFSSNFREK
ncbi:unnamed protein product, partial [marine sediment metagenome]